MPDTKSVAPVVPDHMLPDQDFLSHPLTREFAVVADADQKPAPESKPVITADLVREAVAEFRYTTRRF